jgi:PTS system N-acetylglucosamine-specific IIA component
VIVTTPVAGRVLPLSAVPDPVFADALVGPGLAVAPAPTPAPVVAVSPVDGRVSTLHPHAYVVVSGDRGVLVHLGIDTVRLGGAGFELLVEAGATVACGQPMVRWDPAAVQGGGLSALCPVIALDAAAAELAELASGTVSIGDPLFSWA